jgi:hypothetical protein
VSIIQKVRNAWSYLLTKLNALGSILLAYALLNPDAANELLGVLPEKLRTPAALMIPAAWFLIVQYAKVRDLRKGSPDAAA